MNILKVWRLKWNNLKSSGKKVGERDKEKKRKKKGGGNCNQATNQVKKVSKVHRFSFDWES